MKVPMVMQMAMQRRSQHNRILRSMPLRSRNMCKKGHLTIQPSRVLEGSGLLPPKPDEASAPDTIPSPKPNEHASAPGGIPSEPAVEEPQGHESAKDLIDASFTTLSSDAQEWNWQRVEDERFRGIKLAEMFNGLDGLSGEFRGGDDHALGIFADPF
jgi:hypothetical protein